MLYADNSISSLDEVKIFDLVTFLEALPDLALYDKMVYHEDEHYTFTWEIANTKISRKTLEPLIASFYGK